MQDMCQLHKLDDLDGTAFKLFSSVSDGRANTEPIRLTFNEAEMVEQYLIRRHPDDYNPREGEPFVLTDGKLPTYWYEDKYITGKQHPQNRVADYIWEALPHLHGMSIMDADAAITISYPMHNTELFPIQNVMLSPPVMGKGMEYFREGVVTGALKYDHDAFVSEDSERFLKDRVILAAICDDRLLGNLIDVNDRLVNGVHYRKGLDFPWHKTIIEVTDWNLPQTHGRDRFMAEV